MGEDKETQDRIGKPRGWDDGKRKDMAIHKATELKCNSFDHRHVEKETNTEQPCRKALSLYHRTSTPECPSEVSNICGRGNKQEEFEDCVQLQGYKLWDHGEAVG